MSRPSLFDLENHADFIQRHIGPTVQQQTDMARAIGYDSLDALIDDTVPSAIRRQQPMQLPGAQTEQQVSRGCANWPAAISSTAPSSAWATTTPLRRRSSSAMCWKIRAGTPRIRPTNRKSRRVGWKRC